MSGVGSIWLNLVVKGGNLGGCRQVWPAAAVLLSKNELKAKTRPCPDEAWKKNVMKLKVALHPVRA